MSRIRLAKVVALLGVFVLAAALYHAFGPSSSPEAVATNSSAKRKGAPTGRVVPVITAAAQIQDFSIRRRTIGILESPAIVVVKSRIDSQVLEQHVQDGQIVKKGDLCSPWTIARSRHCSLATRRSSQRTTQRLHRPRPT